MLGRRDAGVGGLRVPTDSPRAFSAALIRFAYDGRYRK